MLSQQQLTDVQKSLLKGEPDKLFSDYPACPKRIETSFLCLGSRTKTLEHLLFLNLSLLEACLFKQRPFVKTLSKTEIRENEQLILKNSF